MDNFSLYMNNELPKVANRRIESDDYIVSAKLSPYTSVLDKRTKEDTFLTTCSGIFTIESKVTGEILQFEKVLLNLPVKTDQGIIIGGNIKQVVRVNKIAPGWYNLPAKKEINEELGEVIENYPTLNFHTDICRMFKIEQKDNLLTFNSSKSSSVNLFALLVLLTGKTPDEIKDVIGSYPPVLSTINNFNAKCLATDGTISKRVLDKIAAHFSFRVNEDTDTSTLMEIIKERFFDDTRYKIFPIGETQHIIRSSFSSRAMGLTLAEDVNCNGKIYTNGTILSSAILTELDKSDVTEIYAIGSDGYRCKLLKLKHDDSRLTIEEFLTEINMYLSTQYGCGGYDNSNNFKSSTLFSYEKRIQTQILEYMDIVISKLEAEMNTEDLTETYNKVIGSVSLHLNLDVIIEEQRSSDNVSSQQADLNNIIAHMAKENRIVSDLKGTGSMEMKAVQGDHFNQIDPCDSVEGKKVGLVHTLAIHTIVDYESNQSKTPYILIDNCKEVSSVPVYLGSAEQEDKYIASWDEKFEEPLIYVAYNGIRTLVPKEQVTLQSYSPMQTGSYARNMIPFQNMLNPKRLTMGVNHLKQAVPVRSGERPLVATGVESLNNNNTSYLDAYTIIKEYLLLQSISVSKEIEEEICSQTTLTVKSIVSNKGQFRTVTFMANGAINKYVDNAIIMREFPFMQRSSQESIFSYNLNKKKASFTNKDIVLVNVAVDIEPVDLVKFADYGHYDISDEELNKAALSIGVNLKVAYKTMGSGNIDDAVVISDRLSKLGSYSLVLETVELKPTEYKDSGKKEVIYEENFAQSAKLDPTKYQGGIVKEGVYLNPGEVVASYTITSSKEDSKSKEKEHCLDQYTQGEVLSVQQYEVDGKSYLDVFLVYIALPYVGDKTSGRYGNKGVISAILPASRMPYDSVTGEPVDMCLNPLGIPSRMNIGQFYEVALALAVYLKGQHAVVSPFKGGELSFIKDRLEIVDAKSHVLYDGLTCKPFMREVFWGVEYILKAEHQINKKAQSTNIAKLSQETFKPVKGRKNNGGQTIGEMESWSLTSAGCPNIMQDIYSSQSTDQSILGSIKRDIELNPRDVIFGSSRKKGSEVSGDNSNNMDFIIPFRCYGVNITSDNNEYGITPLTDKYMESNFLLATSDKEGIYNDLNVKPLSSNKIKLMSDWRYVNVNHKYINPYILFKSDIPKFITVAKPTDFGWELMSCSKSLMAKLFLNKASISTCSPIRNSVAAYFSDSKKAKDMGGEILTGMEAILYLFENANLENTLNYLSTKHDRPKAKRIRMCTPDYDEEKAKKISVGINLQTARQIHNVKEYISKGIQVSDYINTYLPIMPLMLRKEATRELKENDMSWFYHRILNAIPRSNKITETKAFMDTLIDFTGANPEGGSYVPLDETRRSIATKYFGKGTKDHGDIRNSVLSTRTHFSCRSVITPESKVFLEMDEIGIPYVFCVDMYKYHLLSDLREDTFLTVNNLKSELGINSETTKSEADRIISVILDSISSENPNKLAKVVKLESHSSIEEVFEIFYARFVDFCSRQVVIAGRQPTLHKYGIRAFHIVPVNTKTIILNPLVCDAYNADFDGDQMWVLALLRKVSQEEALTKLGTMRDALNPKDSDPTIKHNQDVLLGIYGMTMFKDNCKDLLEYTSYKNVLYVPSVSVLEALVDTKRIQPYDLVRVTNNNKDYVSTAGRILLNSCLEGKGFTDKPFTNPNNIPMSDTSLVGVYDLLLDGVVSKKVPGQTPETRYERDGKTYYMKYHSIVKYCNKEFVSNINTMKEITKPQTREVRQVSVVAGLYQSILEFGFKYCDFLGMSLGLYDFDENTSTTEDKDKAKKLEKQMFKYYSLGLISESSRINSIWEIHKQLNSKFESNVMGLIPRSNNLYITTDSGSKGNSSQIKMIIASVGVSMKTLNESLESPILSNYAEGMDPLEIYLASYGIRMGFISTQDGAPQAGYATRQGEYMLNGMKIVEEDCGNSNQVYKVKYDKLIKIVVSGPDGVKEYGRDCETELNNLLLNKKLDLSDKEMSKYFHEGEFQSDIIAYHYINYILKNKITKITLTDSTIQLSYSLSKYDRSVLFNRAISGNSNLLELCSDILDEPINGVYYINDKIISRMEKLSLPEYGVRTTHNCRTKYGVCATCYGKSFDNLTVPELGKEVGSESAQALGEPSAQLVISLINQGGAADGSIDQGVKMFKYMLNGNLLSAVKRAKIAPFDGYVTITDLGMKKKVTIVPQGDSRDNSKYFNKLKEMNMEDESYGDCLYFSEALGGGIKSFFTSSDELIVKNGEFVKEGQQLTTGKIHPQTISPSTMIDVFKVEANKKREAALVYSVMDIREVASKVQLELAKFYFTIFVLDSDINLNARHFELLSKVQSSLVDVLHADPNSSLKVGMNYELNELEDIYEKDNMELDTSLVIYDVADINSVIRHFTGPFASLGFERHATNLSNLLTSQDIKQHATVLNGILLGEDITLIAKNKSVKKNLNLNIKNLVGAQSSKRESLPEVNSNFNEKRVEKKVVVEPVAYENIESIDSMLFNIDINTSSAFGSSNTKPEIKPEVKPEIKSEVKPEDKSGINIDIKKSSAF